MWILTDANGSTGDVKKLSVIVITQPSAALSSTKHLRKCIATVDHRFDRPHTSRWNSSLYAWTASLGGLIPAGQATNQDLSRISCRYTYDVDL
jgi:hypothetical protein